MPRAKEVKRMKLPLPNPGTDEYRLYFNHRDEQQEQVVTDPASSEPVVKNISVPCADFVAAASETEPTEEDWTALLKEQNYTDDQITKMLAGN